MVLCEAVLTRRMVLCEVRYRGAKCGGGRGSGAGPIPPLTAPICLNRRGEAPSSKRVPRLSQGYLAYIGGLTAGYLSKHALPSRASPRFSHAIASPDIP
eukprot:3432661-Rhodomonas_salina.1